VNKPTHITSHFKKGNDQLSQLLIHQGQLKKSEFELKNLLKSILPDNTPWRLENIREHTLILETNSNAWATRIRFLEREIIKQISTSFPKIKYLSIKTRTFSSEEAEAQHAHPKYVLSEKSAEVISKFAESIEDEQLAKSLKRLSSHTNRR
jgi:hypothetical protein